jgi:PTS system cellobiose-specific IIC component
MENDKFMDKLSAFLMPIGTFLSMQRHISAISAGFMSILPVTLIGAISQIITNPPITADAIAKGGLFASILGPWYNFAQANKVMLSIPYNMTMGIIGVIAAFAIAYHLAKSYKMKQLQAGFISMIMFLMIAGPATLLTLADGTTTVTAIDTFLLGGTGLFTAIVIAIVSVEITRFCERKNLVIKMPEAVPTAMAESFSSIIPLAINLIVIFGFNQVIVAATGYGLPLMIMGILSLPLAALNSIPGMVIIGIFASLLWVMGIHGTMVVFMALMPVLIGAVTQNAELVANGQAPIFQPIFLFMGSMAVGGAGNTLGLVILMLKSKSKQLKAIGQIAIVPGFFGINEPVTFGAPIMYNPILAIPFILSPVINMVILYFAYQVNFIKPPFILIMSLMPIGVGEFLSTLNFTNALLPFLLIPVSILTYYPFFKAYEKQLVTREADQEAELA